MNTHELLMIRMNEWMSEWMRKDKSPVWKNWIIYTGTTPQISGPELAIPWLSVILDDLILKIEYEKVKKNNFTVQKSDRLYVCQMAKANINNKKSPW